MVKPLPKIAQLQHDANTLHPDGVRVVAISQFDFWQKQRVSQAQFPEARTTNLVSCIVAETSIFVAGWATIRNDITFEEPAYHWQCNGGVPVVAMSYPINLVHLIEGKFPRSFAQREI